MFAVHEIVLDTTGRVDVRLPEDAGILAVRTRVQNVIAGNKNPIREAKPVVVYASGDDTGAWRTATFLVVETGSRCNADENERLFYLATIDATPALHVFQVSPKQ